MAQCDVTYELFHPSGLPKIIKVQLSFNQLAQVSGGIQFPGATALDWIHGSNTSFVPDPDSYFGYPLVAKGVNRSTLPVYGNQSGVGNTQQVGSSNVGFQADIPESDFAEEGLNLGRKTLPETLI